MPGPSRWAADWEAPLGQPDSPVSSAGLQSGAMDLRSTPRAAVVARRHRLAEHLGDVPALLAAGAAQPRNYPANAHPFRASSHFLYFVGLAVEGAWLLIDGPEATLFVTPPAADDELWHGPTPSFAALGEAIGCDVRPRDELERALRGRDVATIPVQDLATRGAQESLLLRSLEHPSERDEALMDAIIALRLVHDDAAIAGLREAAAITEAGHRAAMAIARPGIGEHVVRAAFDGAFLAHGAAGHAYSPIVTVHGEVLHSHSYANVLAEGDLLLADVGAESAGGWAGDVTRTWPVSGRFSSTQRELYDVVLASQEAAIAATRPGARWRDVHLLAARVLTEGLVALGIFRGDVDELVADGAHALFFPHGLGHLLGLDVHDMEDLGDHAGYAPGRTRSEQFGLSNLRLDRDLVPGMAVTVEPGFYRVPAILADPRLTAMAGDRLNLERLEHFSDVRGIRIEDDVLVTEDGNDVLTAAIPKTAADVEGAVGR